MPRIWINAPAKLNLHLNIRERRPDGFHDIESLFLALAFGDTLSFETISQEAPFPLKNTEIILDWQLPWGSAKDLSPEKNIVNLAVSLFRERTGFDKRLRVVLEKRIPLGGGLGGGSSDAAAALVALNRLAGRPVSDVVLAEMGASLGSDVPFFMQIALNDGCSLAWVSGRGELVRPLALPLQAKNLSLVLVNPGFPSDTAEAFRLLDDYRELGVNRNAKQQTQILCPESLISILSASPRDWPFSNDFLPVFETGFSQNQPYRESFSTYREIFSALRDMGADFLGLSGSGSTCFGVFSNQSKAGTARVAFETLEFCY